jgi:hypothetical protein
MARQIKKAPEKVFDIEQNEVDLQHLWNEKMQDISNWLEDTVLDLIERVQILEKLCIKPEGKSINKVEKFNNEVPSTIESYNGLRMGEDDKIQSMRNAIKILPPNMIVDGRHLKENIEAVCGFKVLDEMMDAAYEGIAHEPIRY